MVAIAYRLAELTAALLPHHAFDRPLPEIVQPLTPADGRSAANLSALTDAHLFGEANAEPQAPLEPVNAELEAPDTTLDLELTGVTAHENGKLSQAHIRNGQGEERNYALGEEIWDSNGATLRAVYHDRAILNVGGRMEMLRMPGTESLAAPTLRAVVPVSLRNVVTESASSLTDVFRIAVHIEDGHMIGVQINPGRDRETFEALGLMPGDLVTDINGIMLDDPRRVMQIFGALGESTQASITVLRDGVPSVLVIDTTQI